MSRAPSLDASTPVSSANLRLSSSLARLGNSDLQSELFESLLRLPPTTESSPPTNDLPPSDPNPIASFEPSKDRSSNRDQDPNDESDSVIEITDSTSWVNPPPQVAICFDRHDCFPKTNSLPDASQASPSEKADSNQLPTTNTLSPDVPTDAFRPRPPSQPDAKTPEVPTKPLTNQPPDPKNPDADIPNPTSSQHTNTLPPKSTIRSGRAPSSDEADSPHSQSTLPSGQAPTDHSGQLEPTTSPRTSLHSDDATANSEPSPQDPSRPEPIRDPRAIRLEDKSNQHPQQDPRNQDPNSLPEPNPTASQEPLTSLEPIQASDSHPTPEQVVASPSAIDPTTANGSSTTNPVSSAAATAAASTVTTIAPTNDSNPTNSSQNNALASVGSVKGSANTANPSASTRESSPGNGSLSPRQETRLIQRVLRGFEQISEGEGQIKLRLHPPELGSLQISLRIEGEQLIAHLEVENALAKDALTQNIQTLRDRLGEQGLRLERFEVQIVSEQNGNASSNSDSSSGWAGQTSQQRQDPNGRYRPTTWNPNRPLREPDRTPEESSRPRRILPGRGIDLTA